MDFQEIWLADGTAVSILNVVDKATGAMLQSRAIDVTKGPGRRRKVSFAEVQAVLRDTFAVWGRPDRLQTDKELVFEGHPADQFPSRFQQWLAGLGVSPERTRPGRPQDQGRVERTHRTLSDFACSLEERQNLAQFQQALDYHRWVFNTQFPSRAKGCNGQPPLRAHPTLQTPRRPYSPEAEWFLFSLDQVAHLLAQHPLVRKVNSRGQISLGGRLYSVGRRYAGLHVQVQFDPQRAQWRVSTPEGEVIKHLTPKTWGKSFLLNMYPLVPLSLTESTSALPEKMPSVVKVPPP